MTKIKYFIYTDPILDEEYRLKIEKIGKKSLKVSLPEEKNFFRGVEFSEKVQLKKSESGKWTKNLKAKFGAGAKELFGIDKINEESELEARDIRIIAKIESLSKKAA